MSNIVFKKIEKREFNSLNYTLLFNDEKTSRCYGVIIYNGIYYRLGWRSDLIDPMIKELNDGIYALGIDQEFAIIDFKVNSIKLKIHLTYNFCTVQNFENYIFAVTELEIIEIEGGSFKILKKHDLPDIFTSMTKVENKLKVLCEGDIVLELHI